MKLTYLSHSCFFLETSAHRIIIDPFLSGNPLAKMKADEVQCDFILVSTGTKIISAMPWNSKRTGATIVSNFEIAMTCANRGAQNVHPMNPGGGWNFRSGA